MFESFNRPLFNYLNIVHSLNKYKLLELVYNQFAQNRYVPELKNIKKYKIGGSDPYLHYLLISGTKDNFQTRTCMIEGYISNKTSIKDIDSISINILGYVLDESQGCCVPGITNVEVYDVTDYGINFFLIDPDKPLDSSIKKILNIQEN